MRLSRIIIALAAGFAVLAAPAAGSAQPAQPTASPTTGPSEQPPPPEPAQPGPYPPYPPQADLLALNRTTITLGQAVVLRGRSFLSRETVDITIEAAPLAAGQPGTATQGGAGAMAPVAFELPARATSHRLVARANARGNFTIKYTPNRTGVFTFVAHGRRSGLEDTAVLTVLPRQSQAAHGGDLPRTGDSMGSLLGVGGVLVAFGGVMLLMGVAWRRRRHG